ncbi:hypothetical protein EON65_24540 [archaeon]|nr:MAG: hypothetical protein EON65_24540 [archaeon]
MRGNNQGGEGEVVRDVEDAGVSGKGTKGSKAGSAKGSKKVVSEKKDVMKDVLRSFEVSSFSPVDDKITEMKKKAMRCKYICYANVLIPTGLIVLQSIMGAQYAK